MVEKVQYPRKAARLRAKVSLVQVAAAARCTINTAARYEVAPPSVREDKQRDLDAVYDNLEALQAKVA